jgi:hypothetical protein
MENKSPAAMPGFLLGNDHQPASELSSVLPGARPEGRFDAGPWPTGEHDLRPPKSG